MLFSLDGKVTKRSRLTLLRYSIPLGSLSRLKLASLKQQTLRALTPVSALNARLLRPDIEPDSSLGIADTDTYITPKQTVEP